MKYLFAAFVAVSLIVNSFAVTALAASCQHDTLEMLSAPTMVMADQANMNEMPCPDHQAEKGDMDDCGDMCLCMAVCTYPTSLYVELAVFSAPIDYSVGRAVFINEDGVSWVVEPPRYPPKFILS